MDTNPKPKTRYAWNLQQRDISFGPSQRFDDVEPSTRAQNQYTSKSFEEELNQTYVWLIKSTKVVHSHPAGHFQCWVPEGVGIDDESPFGYRRFSFKGRKTMCHVFVWLYHHPNQRLSDDVSHLCSNESCCRPSHLFCESRNKNIERRGCSGYLVSSDGSPTIKICQHEPPCTKTTPYSRDNYVVLNHE